MNNDGSFSDIDYIKKETLSVDIVKKEDLSENFNLNGIDVKLDVEKIA